MKCLYCGVEGLEMIKIAKQNYLNGNIIERYMCQFCAFDWHKEKDMSPEEKAERTAKLA